MTQPIRGRPAGERRPDLTLGAARGEARVLRASRTDQAAGAGGGHATFELVSKSEVIILTPLAFEASAIRRVAARHSVPVIVTGPGQMRTAILADMLMQVHLPALHTAIMCGVAGALHERCPPVAYASPVVEEPAWVQHGGDDEQLRTWLPETGLPSAKMLSAERIIADPARKRELGESSGCEMVDTESAAFVRTAWALGVRAVVLRAVSDGVGESLPAEVERLTQSDGKTNMLAVAGAVLRRPTLIPELMALGRRSSAAMGLIAAELERALPQLKQRPAAMQQEAGR